MTKQILVLPANPIPENMIEEYLSLKSQIVEMTKQADILKKEITNFADSHIEGFDSKGIFELETGLIKIVKNPPKAIWLDNQNPLTLNEKKELVIAIPDTYHKLTIDLAKVAKTKETDKHLKQVLKAKGVDIVQETRYDVKSKK